APYSVLRETDERRDHIANFSIIWVAHRAAVTSRRCRKKCGPNASQTPSLDASGRVSPAVHASLEPPGCWGEGRILSAARSLNPCPLSEPFGVLRSPPRAPVDPDGTAEGYASGFGEIAHARHMVMHGALAQSLATREFVAYPCGSSTIRQNRWVSGSSFATIT